MVSLDCRQLSVCLRHCIERRFAPPSPGSRDPVPAGCQTGRQRGIHFNQHRHFGNIRQRLNRLPPGWAHGKFPAISGVKLMPSCTCGVSPSAAIASSSAVAPKAASGLATAAHTRPGRAAAAPSITVQRNQPRREIPFAWIVVIVSVTPFYSSPEVNHSTICCSESSSTAGMVGIGMLPHTPAPPFTILSRK